MVTATMIIVALSIVLSVAEGTGAKGLPDFSNPVKVGFILFVICCGLQG